MKEKQSLPKATLFDGNTWEDLCNRLLQEKFPNDAYQKIPQINQGDWGIDGYVIRLGIAFQFYCPEYNSKDAKGIYEGQRNKITRDLNKLRKLNTGRNVGNTLFQNQKLQKWVLLCPVLTDKKLVTHCRKKEEDVRSWSLSFISDDFIVQVQDLKDYETEYFHLYKESSFIQRANINITDDERVEFRDEKNNWVNNVSRKITPLYEDQIDERDEHIIAHIDNALKLERQVHELRNFGIDGMIKSIQDEQRSSVYMTAQYRDPISQPLLENIKEAFKQGLPANYEHLTVLLALGTISNWLGDCTLEPQYKGDD